MKHWQFIHSKLKKNTVVYLLTVIQHKGSSPGRQGFKMVVADDNEIYGSIGGGVMEYNLVELCKGLLEQKKYTPFIKHQIHKGTIVDGSGMICSGEQTVVFYAIDSSYLSTIEAILEAYTQNESGVLSIAPSHFSFSGDDSQDSTYSYTHESDTDWSYTEFLNKKDILYVVGGGHVGLATSKLMCELGFYVIVLDNREFLNTFNENVYANEKQIIDYNNVADYIPESNSAYVAIMTNKYTDDKLALSKLLGRNYKFIGVLGSIAKLELMFEVLQKEGFTQEQLSNVHAPIGVKIKSQTPEEIAVSIAAQIIGIRNER